MTDAALRGMIDELVRAATDFDRDSGGGVIAENPEGYARLERAEQTICSAFATLTAQRDRAAVEVETVEKVAAFVEGYQMPENIPQHIAQTVAALYELDPVRAMHATAHADAKQIAKAIRRYFLPDPGATNTGGERGTQNRPQEGTA